MLDKSIPYVNMVMMIPRAKAETVAVRQLPPGYRYKLYEPGDREAWAELETSVLEFSEKQKALSYFEKDFLPFEEELCRRMWFILDENGRYCATTTAWYSSEAPRMGMIHWVACRPDCQGKGLGKAIVTRALRTLCECETGDYFCLHTQTWSHKAVGLYLDLGFCLRKDPEAEDGRTGFEAVRRVLQGVMSQERYQHLLDTAYK